MFEAWMSAPSLEDSPLEWLWYNYADFTGRLDHRQGWLQCRAGKVKYMTKNKPRRLWINVKVAGGVSGVTRAQFIQTLIDSIEAGDYVLPSSWKVSLEWRNKEAGEMKSGTWQKELEDSAQVSDGFDKAVTAWLERKLRKEQNE